MPIMPIHNPIQLFLIQLEKLVVLLRDGRTLIGYLRSIDQFCKFRHSCGVLCINQSIVVKHSQSVATPDNRKNLCE